MCRTSDAAIARFPDAATLVEWDSAIPALDVLVAEARTDLDGPGFGFAAHRG